MRLLKYAVLFLVFSCQSVDDKKSIKDAWNEYAISLVSNSGKEIANAVDKNTMLYYDDLANAVRFEDSLTLSKRYLIEQYMVLEARHSASRDSLLTINGEQLLTLALRDEINNSDVYRKSILSNIVVKGNAAKAILTTDTVKHYSMPVSFVKENGSWKVCVTETMAYLYPKLESFMMDKIKENGLTKPQSVERMVSDYEEDSSTNLWQPLLIPSRQ